MASNTICLSGPFKMSSVTETELSPATGTTSSTVTMSSAETVILILTTADGMVDVALTAPVLAAASVFPKFIVTAVVPGVLPDRPLPPLPQPAVNKNIARAGIINIFFMDFLITCSLI